MPALTMKKVLINLLAKMAEVLPHSKLGAFRGQTDFVVEVERVQKEKVIRSVCSYSFYMIRINTC